MRNVLEAKKFTMSSYVVYVLDISYPYKGLNPRGKIGQNIIYEVYPELHLGHKDYRRANDAFTMHITQTLQNVEHMRLSDGAKGLIKNYGA